MSFIPTSFIYHPFSPMPVPMGLAGGRNMFDQDRLISSVIVTSTYGVGVIILGLTMPDILVLFLAITSVIFMVLFIYSVLYVYDHELEYRRFVKKVDERVDRLRVEVDQLKKSSPLPDEDA
jgi:hypothetical protein